MVDDELEALRRTTKRRQRTEAEWREVTRRRRPASVILCGWAMDEHRPWHDDRHQWDRPPTMMLCGVEVPTAMVEWLSWTIRDRSANDCPRLSTTSRQLALSADEEAEILAVLDNSPAGLQELRGGLLRRRDRPS